MTEAQARQKVVAIHQAWIGKKESDGSHMDIVNIYNAHKPLARGYAVKKTDAWCATEYSAAAIQAGFTDIMPLECSCAKLIELAQKMGIWQENDAFVPEPGDAVLYDWDDGANFATTDCKGAPEHIGTIEKVVGNTMTVIEGNKSDAVGRRELKVNGRYIRGFICPAYVKKATTAAEPKKSVDEIVKEVIAGKWGSGVNRKNRLEAAGYNYSEVQSAVNAALKGTSNTAKKSVDTLAREVIAEKWGSGADRKKRLEAAGYDYNAVQKRVNELLKK